MKCEGDAGFQYSAQGMSYWLSPHTARDSQPRSAVRIWNMTELGLE